MLSLLSISLYVICRLYVYNRCFQDVPDVEETRVRRYKKVMHEVDILRDTCKR